MFETITLNQMVTNALHSAEAEVTKSQDDLFYINHQNLLATFSVNYELNKTI